MEDLADPAQLAALLAWYREAGVDECIGEQALDRYAISEQSFKAAKPVASSSVPSSPPSASRQGPSAARSPAERRGDAPSYTDRASPNQSPAYQSPAQSSQERILQGAAAAQLNAAQLAAEAKNLEALEAVVRTFEGCALKTTATQTVFADGNPAADVMVIGEAPGADEDRAGLPFVGTSGKLLDKMLGSIDLDRTTCYITNVIPWRPPGNRKPTPAEVSICMPFIERHIALKNPRVILLVGELAAQSIFAESAGISRLRGKWQDYATPGLQHPVPAIATFHPAYLLRSPEQKRLAWRDLLALKAKIRELD